MNRGKLQSNVLARLRSSAAGTSATSAAGTSATSAAGTSATPAQTPRGRWSIWQLAIPFGVAAGCDGSAADPETPACVEVDATDCAPLYPPTFDDVFTRTLQPGCATGGGACHASASALGAEQHDFFVDDLDATHARLLEDRGDATFVVAGDAACSSIVVRLLVDDDDLRMPPGSELSAGEVCSVAQWIEQGAMR